MNLGIQFGSEKTLNASLLYNVIGPRLALVGSTPTKLADGRFEQEFPDIYERPRNLLDFQLSKRILKRKGELKLTFSDILNNKIMLYENKGGSKEFDANDRMFSSYTPGTTISIGFNYDFDLSRK